jgi:UDP-N-acetylmuramyl pentapeptide synthase
MKAFLKSWVVRIITTEAKASLSRRSPKIVAVVGSVGKTGTKNALFTVLSSKARVRKTEKNLSAELLYHSQF